MKRIVIVVLAICAFLNARAQQTPVYLDETKPVEQRIDDLMQRMTLDEKIRILHAQSKFSSRGVPRLGIPEFWPTDGPHGIRPATMWDRWRDAGQTNDSCVAFPALTCLAATWNPDIGRVYGRALGEEARYRGRDMILGPGVNIYRTPLGGRNFEYMGEDPYLASVMCVPYIQGIQSTGVSACVKHYVLNNTEHERFKTNVIISDRALNEIYLPAFKAAVQKGKVWAVIGAYTYYKNQPLCSNEWLTVKKLKQEWGFDGVALTDWGATTTTDLAANNGLDMEYGTYTDGLHTGVANAYNNYYLAFPYEEGLLSGKYSMKTLDEKVRRVLRLFYRTTLNPNRARGYMCSEEHYQTALKVAEDGIVLLQNNRNLLPLDLQKTKKVLVVGENAIKSMTVGGGSSTLRVEREISPLEGLKARFEKAGISVDYVRGYVGDTLGTYNGQSSGQSLYDPRTPEELTDEAVSKAKDADVVIFIGGLNKALHQDAEADDRLSYDLPYAQDSLVDVLLKANRNLVFVNISGNAAAMPWKSRVPAIVQAWFLGSEAGEAIAAVLAGDVNPSGKLPFTWPEKLADVGAHALDAYPGTWRADHSLMDMEYKEGIYVGYRWVDHARTKPLFAFGHGLSYTSFKLSNLRASAASITRNDSITFTVNVRNTGRKAGAEVVQLYIHDDQSTLDRPFKELKGFKKVYLEPGESRDVSITIGNDALSFYDEASSSWKSEDGSFTALVGNASDNLPLKLKFQLK